MKIHLFVLALFTLGGYGASLAQVGIGNPNPDSTSVLDLTNPNNRGLVLPSAPNTAAFSTTSTVGMTYFTNDHVFYKRSDGYNALTPWRYKFNGNVSEDVYYNSGGHIGIGSTNLSTAPEAPLHIETDNPINLTGNGSFLIGTTVSTNLVLNSTELQARSAGSASPLKINEDGGDVTFGDAPSPVDVAVSGKVREFHQPGSAYADLVPTGSIMMWYGTTADIPTGWALCDGGSYPRSNNSGNIVTPDLSGKFVVGVGSNGGSNYAAHATGGQDSVALTVAEMPAHNHHISLGTSFSGSHSHSMQGSYDEHDGNGNGGDEGLEDHGSDRTSTDGNHNHAVNGPTQSRGGNAAHENRPAFHALVYIMKL